MTFGGPWTHLYGYSLQPGVWIPALVCAWLYWRGLPRCGWFQLPSQASTRRWRVISFYAGLCVLVFALEGPINFLANYLFWVHMVEHCLVQVVAAPLIVVGAPWIPIWEGLPPSWRRTIGPPALLLFGRPWARAAGSLLRAPAAGLVALAATFWSWHLPAAYDPTLSNQALHSLEYLTLFLGGLLYWSQTVDSYPLRRRLRPLSMAGYLVAGAAVMWLAALILGLASHPFYAPYYDLASRPGGISALTDQQWGAGVAWVPASIPFELMLDVLAYRWLRDDYNRAEAQTAAFRKGHRHGSDSAPGQDSPPTP